MKMTIHKCSSDGELNAECHLNGTLCKLWFWYIFSRLNVFLGDMQQDGAPCH